MRQKLKREILINLPDCNLNCPPRVLEISQEMKCCYGCFSNWRLELIKKDIEAEGGSLTSEDEALIRSSFGFYGYWKKGGCSLPRRLRPTRCLAATCLWTLGVKEEDKYAEIREEVP